MYQRIKNKMDVEITKGALESEKLDKVVLRRINEIVGVLDKEYGGRGSYDMGGYILLFTDTPTYEKYIAQIMEFYHLEKDSCEYSRPIGSEETGVSGWQEELYLLSSDDALVMIYPKV